MHYSRQNPYVARIKERSLLSGPSSTKKTYHISLDLANAPLSHLPGDSAAILPMNDPLLVEEILSRLQVDPTTPFVHPKTGAVSSVQNHLLFHANLAKLPSAWGMPEGDFLDAIDAKAAGFDQIKELLPLLPRFYSIASSQRMFPDEIHLTVAAAETTLFGRVRRGVGSHFLSSLAEEVPLYIQPGHHFRLPPSPNTPVIMIGAGTGIAPYRAFIQERLSVQSKGKNWLFFGERHEASDFYYRSFFRDLEAQGALRLKLAFSRDQEEKIYVQHRLFEERKMVWQWLQEGAHLYVCGDAKNMARDVEATLLRIAEEEGKNGAYLKELKKEKRYLIDVY